MAKRKEPIEVTKQEIAEIATIPLQEETPAQAETITLVPSDKFEKAVQGLRESDTIKNDKGEEVPFEGDTKDAFIGLFQKAYPVMGAMMQSLYETGHLLSEVRKALKPQKLFLTWIRYTGIPERTAYNYLRVYEGFGEQLPQLSHLGIKRLLIASRIPNCAEYVQDNEEMIATEPAEEFEKQVRTLQAKREKKKGGRKPKFVEVGGCKVRPSGDGTKILIEGLTAKRQKEILEGIKDLLSKSKE
ncbi:MAG: hypothetical protein HY912_14755 [Desulfomonile tiedjei]|uniref:Uncharacterized protein n=1 Tax=Desulfomonile tiedjei TaxID=2358 RepID=A0A9D6V2N0_9BACT|nr:hypothetical protein [Desulfomonile tiedjei]